jgi:hypothetical protein
MIAIKPGTDVMIFEKNFAEKFGENMGVFLLKLLLVFEKNIVIKLVFEKNGIFSQKIGKNRRQL